MGNGRKNGIERINVLLNHIEVSDDAICFNSAAYHAAVTPYLEEHKTILLQQRTKSDWGLPRH